MHRCEAKIAYSKRKKPENSRLLTQSHLFRCPSSLLRKRTQGCIYFQTLLRLRNRFWKALGSTKKNCNSSYFLSYSPVREFIASKVRFSSPFGYSHCMKILKTIPDHYESLGSANYRYEAKKTRLKGLEKSWKICYLWTLFCSSWSS